MPAKAVGPANVSGKADKYFLDKTGTIFQDSEWKDYMSFDVAVIPPYVYSRKVSKYFKKLNDCIHQTNDILFPMSVMFANDFSALSTMLAFAREIKGSWRFTSAPMKPRTL